MIEFYDGIPFSLLVMVFVIVIVNLFSLSFWLSLSFSLNTKDSTGKSLVLT